MIEIVEKIRKTAMLATVKVADKYIYITHFPLGKAEGVLLVKGSVDGKTIKRMIPDNDLDGITRIVTELKLDPKDELQPCSLSEGVCEINSMASVYESEALAALLKKLGGSYTFRHVLWMDGIKGDVSYVGIKAVSFEEQQGLSFDAYSDTCEKVYLDDENFSIGDLCSILQAVEEELTLSDN